VRPLHPYAVRVRTLRLGLLAALLAAVPLAGCFYTYGPAFSTYTAPDRTVDLAAEIDAAAKRLLAGNPALATHSPMIAATFVDIDDLRSSSTFGRISSELFASALSRAGVRTREVKMRESLFIEQRLGELILSREVKRLRDAFDANSILMGTYAEGDGRVLLSVRVVRTRDAVVLATAELDLPIDNNLRSLLGQRW
jgi:TolB-like protein